MLYIHPHDVKQKLDLGQHERFSPQMTTERASPRYAGIDVWEPADILESLVEGQFAAGAAVRAALPEIEAAAIAMQERLRERGRLVYAGAGTSGRMGVQDGAEVIPNFSVPAEPQFL